VTYVLGHVQQEGSAALAHYDMWEGLPEKKRALTRWDNLLTGIITKQESARPFGMRGDHGSSEDRRGLSRRSVQVRRFKGRPGSQAVLP
jgi:hypothetical protein